MKSLLCLLIALANVPGSTETERSPPSVDQNPQCKILHKSCDVITLFITGIGCS